MANRTARRLAITQISLACCALEASAGIETWLSTQSVRDGGEADLNVLVVSGTITYANEHLVVQAYEQLAEPGFVMAFGVCAISGGPYWDSYAVRPGISGLVPVDLLVPGCPPTPADLVTALDTVAAGGVL